jgi:hypothetical protein
LVKEILPLLDNIYCYLNFARAYGFHLRGIEGEVVALYLEPLITKQMEPIGAPERWKLMRNKKNSLDYHIGKFKILT